MFAEIASCSLAMQVKQQMLGSTGVELRTSLKAECDYSAKPRVDESTGFVCGSLIDLLTCDHLHEEELDGEKTLLSRVLKHWVILLLILEDARAMNERP